MTGRCCLIGWRGRTLVREIAATVVANEQVSSVFRVLRVKAPGFEESRPGQFAQVLCREPGQTAPFLRRPFSIMEREGEEISFLYKVIGVGTGIMARWRVGDQVSVLGPLGRGYGALEEGDGPALVVAGGTGLGGVFALLRELEKRGYPGRLLLGVRCDEELPQILVDSLSIPVQVVVQEREGFVTGPLAELPLEDYGRAAVCGPMAMIRATAALLAERIPVVELSLEEMMGCGFGICYTCPVPRRDGAGYLAACDDGPVFRAEQIKV